MLNIRSGDKRKEAGEMFASFLDIFYNFFMKNVFTNGGISCNICFVGWHSPGESANKKKKN